MSDLETLILIEKRSKLLHIALGVAYSFGLLTGIGGIAIALFSGLLWLLAIYGLFSIPLMAFCIHLLRLNRNPELMLTPAGFSERTETDYRNFSWSDVERFAVYRFRARYKDRLRVGFNFSDSFRSSPAYKKVRLSAKIERQLTGYDWHLSNFYGQEPAQLSALMNLYRQQSQQPRD